MKTQVTVSQEDLRALHNCIAACAEYLRANDNGSLADVYLSNELELAHKVTAYIAQELYQEWASLPEGTPLKEMYRDDVWHPEHIPTNDNDT